MFFPEHHDEENYDPGITPGVNIHNNQPYSLMGDVKGDLSPRGEVAGGFGWARREGSISGGEAAAHHAEQRLPSKRIKEGEFAATARVVRRPWGGTPDSIRRAHMVVSMDRSTEDERRPPWSGRPFRTIFVF